MIRVRLGCMVASMLLVASCIASELQDVAFFYSHQPPFEFTDAQGNATGIGIERARQLLSAKGLRCEFHYNSVSRGEAAGIVNSARRYNVDSVGHGVRLVELERLPYFLTYTHSQADIKHPTLQVEPLPYVPVHLVVSRQHPLAHQLMQPINSS